MIPVVDAIVIVVTFRPRRRPVFGARTFEIYNKYVGLYRCCSVSDNSLSRRFSSSSLGIEGGARTQRTITWRRALLDPSMSVTSYH